MIQESESGRWEASSIALGRSLEEIKTPTMKEPFDKIELPGGSKERPGHFLKYCRSLGDTAGEAFWGNLIDHWSSFDLIPHEEFSILFCRFRRYSPKANLPDRVTIYRGQDDGKSLGLSWTTDWEVAKGFAEGHRGKNHPNPRILSLEVTRDKIAFLCNDREESEIVLFEIPDDSEIEVIWDGE
jgi:hypothetical protein